MYKKLKFLFQSRVTKMIQAGYEKEEGWKKVRSQPVPVTNFIITVYVFVYYVSVYSEKLHSLRVECFWGPSHFRLKKISRVRPVFVSTSSALKRLSASASRLATLKRFADHCSNNSPLDNMCLRKLGIFCLRPE